MATIRDIAKRSGVSTATVSHVLNDTRKVTPETRKAVLEAVRILKYRPNAIARSLNTNVTNTIGVMVANITFPFFAELVRGIEQCLIPHNYSLIVCNTDENVEREAHYLEQLYKRRVDGVIIIATGSDHPVLAEFASADVPLIFLDRKPSKSLGSFVGMDNEQAGYLATKYLIGLGHKRIGLLARSHMFSTMRGRMDGYTKALREHKLPKVTQLIHAELKSVEDASEGAKQLLTQKQRPTAIIATNYTMTLGVMNALQTLDLECPEDVSVLCFDDSAWAKVLSLTVVAQPVKEMCESAVKLMLAAIGRKQSEKSDPSKVGLETEHPGTLLERGSCTAPSTK